MTDETGILVLFNPSAGGGRAGDKRARLEGMLRSRRLAHELVVTDSEAHLRELASRAARAGRTLVGAGGDSTFHILANEIMAAGGRAPLGLIGLGSSNDIPLEFGLEDMDRAVRALERRRVKPVDLGLIAAEGHPPIYFLGQANIGLGAFVNRYVAERAGRKGVRPRGQTASGILGIIDAYRTRKVPVSLEISWRGGRRSGPCTLAVFSNIRYWATGKRLCPEARPDDGLLDACVFEECSFPRLARLYGLARRGRHVGRRGVHLRQAPAFEAAAEEPYLVQTDGEVLSGPEGPRTFRMVRFEAVPAALNLIA